MEKKTVVLRNGERIIVVVVKCEACELSIVMAEKKWEEYQRDFDYFPCPICLEEIWKK